MDTIDLKIIISSDYKLSKTFGGVFAYDRLPSVVRTFPSSYIVNTDSAKKKGRHWIALYFESSKLCDIFDSYGLTPFGRIYSFASDNSETVHYNNLFLQDPSSKLCGLYCLYFLYYRSRGYSLENIINSSFVEYSWKENDVHVRDIIRSLID